jgi:hypothetical protein
MAEKFSRAASGYAFKFGGLDVTTPPDKMAEHKYPTAQNIRAYDDVTIRSRPGLSKLADSGTGLPVEAIRAYAALETDNQPRYLFKSGTSMYLDNGSAVDSGYADGLGATLIPYRPNQSPTSWMYSGDQNQYRKISAPDGTGAVTAQNAGVIEPQDPVDAYFVGANYYQDFVASGPPTAAGSASAPAPVGPGISDTVGAVFHLGPNNEETYIQVGTIPYIRWLRLVIASQTTIILDVFQPIQPVIVAGVYYYSGNSGRCVITPEGLGNPPAGPSGGPASIYSPEFLQSLRRGAMVQIGSEVCLVTGIATGPDGSISFETSTTSTVAVGALVSGVRSIRIRNIASIAPGMTINAVLGSTGYGVTVNSGIGTLSFGLTGNPFGNSATPFQSADYVSLYLSVDFIDKINEIKFVVDVGVGPVDYVSNIYYYSIRPNDITLGLTNAMTQLGVAQIVSQRAAIDAEAAVEAKNQGTTVSSAQMQAGTRTAISVIRFPISSMTRAAPLEQQTLQNARGVQIVFNASGLTPVILGAFAVMGGGQLDVGQVGEPYQYLARPRSALTGAKGNPSPVMRYGVSPRRDNVEVALPTTYPDPQMDTWDVFRKGGTLTAYTYVGSVPLGSSTTFLDTYFDDAVAANDQIEYDNYQPWPSVGPPINGTASVVGTTMVTTFPAASAAPAAAPTLNQLGKLLPGNLIQTGQQVYTLWTRPTLLYSTDVNQTWLLQLVENAGASLSSTGSLGNVSGTVPASDYLTKITYNPSQYEFVGTQLRTRGGVSPGTVTDYVIARNFGLAVPAGMNIVGVEVTLNWVGQVSGTGLLSGVSLYSGGVQIGATKNPGIYNSSGITNAVLGGFGDTWSAALSPAVVNDSSFGFGVQITAELAGGTDRSFLDYFSITVHYASTPVSTTVPVFVNEPSLANQVLPYLWGPTEEGGNIFAVGDQLRPGFVSFCKNFQPDSVPDSYNIELCPPSEPLLGGELLNGNSYVASTNRWWQLRPSFGGKSQYTQNEAPVGRGLAAPFGHCTDGSKIYFVAKDGIYVTAGGPAVSLTDDLYVLFPHEGIPGKNVTYGGVTTYAPDYGRASTFRLAYYKSYLWFNYQDSTGTPRTLVYNTRLQAWSTDVLLGGVGASVHYGVEQQAGSLAGGDTTYPAMVIGGANGEIYQEADNALDDTSAISCALATREATCGDDRALKLFGDCFLDFLNPVAVSATNLQFQAMSLGAAFSTTALTQNAARQQIPVDVSGGTYSFAMGIRMTWTMGTAMPPVVFYTWQPSYIVKPETIALRAQDWDNAGYEGAKWMQGFLLEANTFGNDKLLGIRNGDNQVLQQVFTINHAIQSEKAYSFTTPFVAHMVRYEPQDGVFWMDFNVKWIWQRTPETVTTWWTQFSDLGWETYGHVFSVNVAYASQAPVTMTVYFDAFTQTYTLPSTGGVYKKFFQIMQANKGKLYAFRLQSTSGFADLQVWEDDTFISVGGWDRRGPYRNHAAVGGSSGDRAQI